MTEEAREEEGQAGRVARYTKHVFFLLSLCGELVFFFG
jgi:hypothetical protein